MEPRFDRHHYALGTLIAWGVPRQIMGLFDADEAMIAVGVPMLRITSLGFLVSTLGTVMAGCFEALGKGLYSLSISLLRQLLVIPPLAMVFSLSWGLNGVWAAFPGSGDAGGSGCSFVIP